MDGHHVGLPYHVELLSDAWRLTAWKQAIEATIRPGDVVLDVGTGAGVMAVWAARAGASRVIAVESADVASLAAETMVRNGVQDVVEVVHADLASLTPEPVDVILVDCVGRLIPDGTMRRAAQAARAWATGQTRWLPQHISLCMAIAADLALPAMERWEHPLLGVDLGAAVPDALRIPWSVSAAPDELLGSFSRVASYEPRDLPERLLIEANLHGRAGVSRGIIAWFQAELAPGITLDTGPGRRTFWGQVLWPMPRTRLGPDAEIQVQAELRAGTSGVEHTWSLQVQGGSPAAPLDPVTRPHLALPDLLAEGIPSDKAGLTALITALYQTGDPGVAGLLTIYERRFGRHPLLRRG